MSNDISAVLFDVGGVLVDVDGVPSLARLLQREATREEIHRLWLACPSVVEHETGRISAREFAPRIVADLSLSVTPDEFLADFDGWLRAPFPGAFDLVERIPSRYKVGILSNMCASAWDRIIDMGLPDRFDAICVSHEIGVLKPSERAFQVALSELGVPASQVLFLDDGAANVTAANTMGLKAHIVAGPREVEAVLVEYGVI